MKHNEGWGFLQAVILAGGLGTRMREETEFRPKPLVEIGGKPVLWHIMKNLSSQGVNDFIILTGYKGDMIRRYFLDLRALENDFSISYKTGQVQYHSARGEQDWKVTVLDTGAETLTAGRLAQARPHIDGPHFLLTYGDGLADIEVAKLVEHHSSHGLPFTVSVTSPSNRFGVIRIAPDSVAVAQFLEKPRSEEKINMGYMILQNEIFNYLIADEPLESGPLPRIAREGLLGAYFHQGFFHPMDTIRDQNELEGMLRTGTAPWVNWEEGDKDAKTF